MITGSIPAPRHPATVLLVALTPLAGCDENATTAPEEPPRERAVEVQEPVPDVDVAFVRFYSWTYMGDGTDVFQYRDGAIYAIDFLGDTIPFDTGRYWRSGRPLPTHETVNWDDFTICADCGLELTEVVRFGDADGPGTIESVAPRVTWSAQLGYVVVGSTYLQIFDKDGRFARRVGREGDGPGKFLRVVDAHVVDGRLVALDDANRAWSIFNLAGDFVERRPYGYSPGPFVPVGGNHVVVVAIDQSPAGAGFPLHLADIDSGVPLHHFGSRSDARGSGPYSNSVQGSVTSRPGTVWWGGAGSPRVQEWSVDDDLLRVIEGDLPWFPEVTKSIDPTREPPSTLLRSLALDAREHLWMTTRTADPQWREVELERTPEGWRVPPERRVDYMDTRLDIFDLEERRHLGSHVWDSPYARLINLGGEPAVTIVEHNDEMVPQVVVQRVHRDNASSRKE
ncbi:MAG: 6-bladed beta-propeller [Gemmatimonadetes bacterium]|nr:6-bladed beta-propeller [Gemmatimonadota bacterium]MYE69006.1 6-bladed beta-propeller [Gemmatimonadota bacterium]MYJ68487.1 6-bladed beta-propeller [Gemmatimonadota bacterium]